MQQQLVIDAATVRKEYPGASSAMKAIFEQSFGKDFFSQDVRDRIQNIDDVFREAGIDKEGFYETFGSLPDHILATMEAEVIAKAYNEGKQPDSLWYPYFYLSNTPGGFRFFDSFFVLAHSNVGSRLCFVNCKCSDDAGKKFTAIYKRFIDRP